MGNSASLIDASATVDPTARLGLGCLIKQGAVVEADAVLGAGVVVGERAFIGKGANLHSAVKVGTDAVVEAGAKVGAGTTILEHAIVGKSCIVGVGVFIQAHGEVGANSTLGTGVVVEAHTRVAEGRVVSAGARVRANSIPLGDTAASALHACERAPLLEVDARGSDEGSGKPVCALVIIDVQNDYISGTLALKEAPAGHEGYEVIPVINELASTAQFDHVFVSLSWHPFEHVRP